MCDQTKKNMFINSNYKTIEKVKELINKMINARLATCTV